MTDDEICLDAHNITQTSLTIRQQIPSSQVEFQQVLSFRLPRAVTCTLRPPVVSLSSVLYHVPGSSKRQERARSYAMGGGDVDKMEDFVLQTRHPEKMTYKRKTPS
jgi:hypothetical protein